MSNPRLNPKGQTFGQLTALSFLELLPVDGSIWLFGCSCGAVAVYPASRVVCGKLWRCRECYLKALRKGRAPQKSRAKPRTPKVPTLPQQFPREYSSWKSMLARCSSANKANIKNYSGRGIALEHSAWRSFAEFLKDMGPRPEKMSLERIRNNEGYRPNNCEWATAKQQCSNTRVAHRLLVRGQEMTATTLATLLEVSIPAICSRVKRNGIENTVLWAEQQLGTQQ